MDAPQAEAPRIAGVRFSDVGKVYHFEIGDVLELTVGDQVVVETSRGWQMGEVAQLLTELDSIPEGGWKSIDRRATPRDLLLRQLWQQKEAQVIEAAARRADELKLRGVKIVDAEYSFDGARVSVFVSTETEDKYDMKSLRGDLQRQFGPALVEIRQIGPRDVAKSMCGMGACGLEKRCCCAFLTEFSSISIRMAKDQGISLTPTEITGMCGRLRCCLIYEYENYVEARRYLPKRNKHVRTPEGDGKVIDVFPLRMGVLVDLGAGTTWREFPITNIIVLDAEGNPVAMQPVPEVLMPVVKQPSEIDQYKSGNEISPDVVEGVGDYGRQAAEAAANTERVAQQQARSRRGERGDAQRPPRGNRSPADGQSAAPADAAPSAEGRENRNRRNRSARDRRPAPKADGQPAPQQGGTPRPPDEQRPPKNRGGGGRNNPQNRQQPAGESGSTTGDTPGGTPNPQQQRPPRNRGGNAPQQSTGGAARDRHNRQPNRKPGDRRPAKGTPDDRKPDPADD